MPEIYALDLRRSINSCDFQLSLGKYTGLRIKPANLPVRQAVKFELVVNLSRVGAKTRPEAVSRSTRNARPCTNCRHFGTPTATGAALCLQHS
jgi:hypothetical protein